MNKPTIDEQQVEQVMQEVSNLFYPQTPLRDLTKPVLRSYRTIANHIVNRLAKQKAELESTEEKFEIHPEGHAGHRRWPDSDDSGAMFAGTGTNEQKIAKLQPGKVLL